MGRQLTHIDLFSGIGGFTLACEWNWIKTEVFCERDERCRRFLERTYPGVPIIGDVRDFDGTKWTDRFILTAGVPCQPASRAGKQRGKADDRWLWDDLIRVVSQARPAWVLCENPAGIGDVGLRGILADLEATGYEAVVLGISACAVNSPQLRNRYWIVGYSKDNGRECTCFNQNRELYKSTRRISTQGASQSHMADTENKDGSNATEENRGRQLEQYRRKFIPSWSNSVWLPCADGKVRRAPDDSFGVAHGLHRSVLAALGNSIVPQVAAEIIRAIKEAHETHLDI